MNILITHWALDAYLDLRHKHAFTRAEYKERLRPDALLLQNFPEPVALIEGNAFLCGAYVKQNPKQEARQLAKFNTLFVGG